MIEALFTLVGTILGFLLNELTQSIRDKRKQNQLSKSVKSIVSLEIDNNIGLINRIYKEALIDTSNSDESVDSQINYSDAGRKLINLPIPSFSNKAFDTQLPDLGQALSRDELNKCFSLYNDLSRIEAIKNALLIASRIQREEWQLASDGSNFVPVGRMMGLSRPFDRTSPNLVMELAQIITSVISIGNPLKSQ